MREGCLALSIQGESLELYPERAVLWRERRTLIVADTHFGKSSIFRRHGVAVPAGSDAHDRDRLTCLVRSTGAQRLIVLGDFLHGPLAAGSEDALELESWSRSLLGTEILVIAGNHDRVTARDWQPSVRWQADDLTEPPFRFTHDAARGNTGLFTLSGHIHPVARLGGLRKRAPRVPIFWQRSEGLVLPSFGVFTGGYVVAPAATDRVFAVGPQGVVRFR